MINSTSMDYSASDNSPLPPACVKFLTDKDESKRRMAASEIEKMTFDFSSTNNLSMVNRLITVLGRNFCLSTYPNHRKGGLIGLAAVMIGFKNVIESDGQLPENMIEEVIRPILTCFLDPDAQIRYYACESLYNVTKVANSKIFPLFESIFDCLAKIVADSDRLVRRVSESLDRLLKDIVIEYESPPIKSFIPKLQEYIYTENPYTKQFIISWIRALDSKVDVIAYLEDLLDGLLFCLYDEAEEIRAATLGVLPELLSKLVMKPTDQIKLKPIIEILLKHAKNFDENGAQYTAIAWIRELVEQNLFRDEKELIDHTPNILSAILPSLASQVAPEGSRNNSISEIASIVNSTLLDQVVNVFEDRKKPPRAELEPILDVLIEEIQTQPQPVIKLAVLEWLKRLKKAEPELTQLSGSQSKLFHVLLDTLSAQSDTVVESTLLVLADWYCIDGQGGDQQVPSSEPQDEANASSKEDEASEQPRKSPLRTSGQKSANPKKVAIADSNSSQKRSTGADRFIQALYQLFREKDLVFKQRGTFIILNLCSMVKPDVIYKSFAEIINDDKSDPKFACSLVSKLNHILITTKPLSDLRLRMANEDDPEMATLFYSLYNAWCHSPVSVLTLCLLNSNFKQANGIVVALSQTDISEEVIKQIEWVVQLIESPAFSPLRMKLLDLNVNQFLLQSLYGLLMVLPQSESYNKLSHRLDQAYKYMNLQSHFKSAPSVARPTTASSSSSTSGSKKITVPSYESLMKHYLQVQSLGGLTTNH